MRYCRLNNYNTILKGSALFERLGTRVGKHKAEVAIASIGSCLGFNQAQLECTTLLPEVATKPYGLLRSASQVLAQVSVRGLYGGYAGEVYHEERKHEKKTAAKLRVFIKLSNTKASPVRCTF